MALTKEAILAANDLQTRVVDVPEWGGEVILKTLSGMERNAFENSLYRINGERATPNMANMSAKLLARVIVDEQGNRIFTDGDIMALGGKSAAVLSRLFEIASEMNGLGEDAIDDAEGNSEAGQAGDSSSS